MIPIKALVFDLDGTAIPKQPNGMPSQAVIDAVQEVQKLCVVSIATGRPYSMCKDVVDALGIDDLCIVNGGSHLYSRATNDYVWKQEVDQQTLQALFAQLQQFGHYDVADEKNLERVKLTHYQVHESIALSCIFAVTKEDAHAIVKICQSFPEVTAHSMRSWTQDAFDVHITHELATKKHALASLLARSGVAPEATMVVGDGGNDLPLFELAGWKVAMGNADDELKAQADWVAPSVDEDGLAVAIRKFVARR